ncbi:MAG: hypothetical protein HC831_30660 [Chloroflexia bacterium]|nr:hypothetical protein [Chloroflexia bacterium]
MNQFKKSLSVIALFVWAGSVVAQTNTGTNRAERRDEPMPANNAPATQPNTPQDIGVDTRGYNVNSVHPIHDSHIMFKRTVWRLVDMDEKQNRPFMAVNNEISKVIFDAVKSGKVIAYDNDSLDRKLSISDFSKRIVDQNVVPIDFPTRRREIQNDSFLTPQERAKALKELDDQERNGGGATEKFARDFSQMQIKEDLIFHKF